VLIDTNLKNLQLPFNTIRIMSPKMVSGVPPQADSGVSIDRAETPLSLMPTPDTRNPYI
jgi:hypothetical protein